MKIFADTGSIKEIQAIADLGILDGVTTNPSLLAKESGDVKANLKKICEIVKGPVSGEVIATDFAGMMREGHDIAKIHEHMIVAISWPSRIIPAKSVAMTSPLTGPLTISQIFFRFALTSPDSLASSDGFVVTPSRMPRSAIA